MFFSASQEMRLKSSRGRESVLPLSGLCSQKKMIEISQIKHLLSMISTLYHFRCEFYKMLIQIDLRNTKVLNLSYLCTIQIKMDQIVKITSKKGRESR
jgi:hypothetical protein